MSRFVIVALVVFGLIACGDPSDEGSEPAPDAGTLDAAISDAQSSDDSGSPDPNASTGCEAPEEDCDGTCVDTRRDPDNCGGCGNVCAAPEGAESTGCTEGSCEFECLDGRFDLNDDLTTPDGDGCEATCAPTGDEECDGIDNNCDGSIDEGCDCARGEVRTCGTAVGECELGEQTCAPDGTWGGCENAIMPSAEVCDSLDNDCDGDVDENPTDANQDCDTGQPGACSVGQTTCSNGSLLCNLTTLPSNEICDGIDNNCNGSVDEGDPGGGMTCMVPMNACEGVTECSNGAVMCMVSQMPEPELCDGVDNDCDGDVDEGNPEGGAACDTMLPGICSAGTERCSNGSVECVQNEMPQTEICDGLNNNCDTQTDETCPNLVGFQFPQLYSTSGPGGGNEFTINCGARGTIESLRISSGSHVSSVRGLCKSLELEEDTTVIPYDYRFVLGSSQSFTNRAGNNSGTMSSGTCPQGEYAIGVFGSYDVTGMTEVGIKCGEIDIDDSTFALSRSQTTDISAGGPGGGMSFSFDCPNTSVLTGVRGFEDGTRITSFGARCTQPTLIF